MQGSESMSRHRALPRIGIEFFFFCWACLVLSSPGALVWGQVPLPWSVSPAPAVSVPAPTVSTAPAVPYAEAELPTDDGYALQGAPGGGVGEEPRVAALPGEIVAEEGGTGAVATPAGVTEEPSSAVDEPQFRLEEWFPASLRQKRLLIADYQWISLFALVVLGVVADIAVRFAMQNLAKAWFRLMRMQSAAAAERRLWRPLGLLAQSLVWYSGTMLVNLPPQINTVLVVGLKIFAVWVTVWTISQWIDMLAAYFARRAAMTVSKFDDLLVPLVSKSLKILTMCMGALICAETLHLPVTGLIGGLGLGGAALAFASKDAISNLFGSFTVLVDRPFEIGDWIIIDGVEGTVEQVGFRSTRVRTFYNSQISIPNSTFTTAVVDNMGRRHYQRVKTMLGVEYSTTTEQIEAFCEGIRELLRNHPNTRKDAFHVYFNEFGPSSLNIMLSFFLMCRDRPAELQSQHELYLDIIRLAKALDVSFAFPTQTLHVVQDDKPAGAKVLEFKQPAAVGRHEAAKLVELRAGSAKRYPEVA
jgi:MscS family membrane protein